MAYLTVTTQLDVVDPGDGKLSLREAVAQANASASPDSIRFLAALEGQTLVLTGGELVVEQDLTIDGDLNVDGSRITVDGNHQDRIFRFLGAATDAKLLNLTLLNGYVARDAFDARDDNGGAVFLSGSNLIVEKSTITGNYVGYFITGGAGGAIYATENSTLRIYSSVIDNNYVGGFGGGISMVSGILSIDGSKVTGNGASYDSCGGIALSQSNASITRTEISSNRSMDAGGGLCAFGGVTNISNATIANNSTSGYDASLGGGVAVFGAGVLTLSDSTITGNSVGGYDHDGHGGGIATEASVKLAVFNTSVVGNKLDSHAGPGSDADVSGTITMSNGHNVFGTDVLGNIPGDRENVVPGTIFAAVDPVTGGGKLSPTGIVPLKNALTNPALSAADPITASSFGQLGTTKRPLPAGSLPDIGSIEINQPLSTSPTVNNDVLTGSNAANNLAGLGGNDLIKGLGGVDTLNGNDGSDVLDGGPGNDVLNGGTGTDIASFAGNTAVVVDLSAKPATAKRGSETDTLTSIEGVIGSDRADTFRGDGQNNEFQGGLGKDTATGGAGRDLYAFKSVQDSPAGAGRDVIKDFAPGQDVIDVSDIDADSTTPGQQSFRWVGKAMLTGAAQLGYYVSSGNTIVRASPDADAAAEVEIQLTGVKTLTPADFRF